MIISNKKLLSIFLILAILIFASAFLIYISSQREQQGLGKVLSQEQAIQRALDYINQNLLRGENKATLLESSEERGLYKFKLKIGEQEFESYVTKDGSLLFPEAIVLKEVSESTESLPELHGNCRAGWICQCFCHTHHIINLSGWDGWPILWRQSRAVS